MADSSDIRSSPPVVLITAGPTHEPIDAVRYVGNRSSGKMGYALACAARDRGCEVVLVSGPVAHEAPAGVEVRRVESAREMCACVEGVLAERSVALAIFSAAVADFQPCRPVEGKMKKEAIGARWVLEMERTPDILGSMRRRFGYRGMLVGFAAETADVEANAGKKLKSKGCDFVVANDVSVDGIGFGSDDNAVLLVDRMGGREALGPMAKSRLAEVLMERFLVAGSADSAGGAEA